MTEYRGPVAGAIDKSQGQLNATFLLAPYGSEALFISLFRSFICLFIFGGCSLDARLNPHFNLVAMQSRPDLDPHKSRDIWPERALHSSVPRIDGGANHLIQWKV